MDNTKGLPGTDAVAPTLAATQVGGSGTVSSVGVGLFEETSPPWYYDAVLWTIIALLLVSYRRPRGHSLCEAATKTGSS